MVCQTPPVFTPVDGGVPGGDCAASGWCKESPQPQYSAAVALSATDVWAALGTGVRHFDGTRWSWAFGGVQTTIDDGGNPSFAPLVTALWANSDTDVWVGTDDPHGAFLHFDGTRWATLKNGATTGEQDYVGLWGSGPDDVWALSGLGGGLFHWNGCLWKSAAGGPAFGTALWGTGPDDVWATGGTQTYHYDGTFWLERPNQTADAGAYRNLYGLGSSGPDDFWAVGDDETTGTWGTILQQFDGGGWQEVSSPRQDALPGLVPASLRAVWGVGPGDVWAFGADLRPGSLPQPRTLILHSDGGAFVEAANPFSGQLRSREIFAATGTPDFVWALGESGAVLRYGLDAGTWTADFVAPSSARTGVWSSGPGDVWFAGPATDKGGGAELFHWDGGSLQPTFQSDAGLGLTALSGSGPDDVWAVGYGTALAYDGGSWAVESSGLDSATQLNGLWVASAGERWAVGQGGAIDYGLSGATDVTWTRSVSNPADSANGGYLSAAQALYGIYGVGGALFAVGDNHLANDGGTFATVLEANADGGSGAVFSDLGPAVSSRAGPLRAVWGPSATELWAVGDGLWHWVSPTWTFVPVPAVVPQTTYTAVWGSAADQVWFGGQANQGGTLLTVLLQWDGQKLTLVDTPDPTIPGGLTALFGTSATDVWAVGLGGTILHL